MILDKRVHGGTAGIEVVVPVAAVEWDGIHLTELEGQHSLSGTPYERRE